MRVRYTHKQLRHGWNLRANQKIIALQETPRHFHSLQTGIRDLDRHYPRFGRKTNRLELDRFAVDGSFTQVGNRQGEAESGKCLAWLDIDFLGEILVLRANLRRGRAR